MLALGHGTGGVLACLEAAYLATASPSRQLTVVTFGAPKFSGRNFANVYRSLGIATYRIVNRFDPVSMVRQVAAEPLLMVGQVPRYPFWFPRIHHVPSTVYHLYDGGLHRAPATRRFDFILPGRVDDHRTVEYEAAMRSWMKAIHRS